jgi:hypothetical protein
MLKAGPKADRPRPRNATGRSSITKTLLRFLGSKLVHSHRCQLYSPLCSAVCLWVVAQRDYFLPAFSISSIHSCTWLTSSLLPHVSASA